MNSLIDTQKFETLITAHWTHFFNTRNLMTYASECAQLHLGLTDKANHLKISHAELTTGGLLIWLEYTINGTPITTEFVLNDESTIHHTTFANPVKVVS